MGHFGLHDSLIVPQKYPKRVARRDNTENSLIRLAPLGMCLSWRRCWASTSGTVQGQELLKARAWAVEMGGAKGHQFDPDLSVEFQAGNRKPPELRN